jgi:hypothetical protein
MARAPRGRWSAEELTRAAALPFNILVVIKQGAWQKRTVAVLMRTSQEGAVRAHFCSTFLIDHICSIGEFLVFDNDEVYA